ncbi:MAG: hypothetical protein AVDCRST_MAG85-2337, partial [uncultured Solirubrobacteraceae bacterium]
AVRLYRNDEDGARPARRRRRDLARRRRQPARRRLRVVHRQRVRRDPRHDPRHGGLAERGAPRRVASAPGDQGRHRASDADADRRLHEPGARRRRRTRRQRRM